MTSTVPSNCIAEASDRIGRALALSPADHTEIFWRATVTAEVATAQKGDAAPTRRELITVRVTEKGRSGTFVASDGSTASLADAVRQAMAHARADAPAATASAAPIPAPDIDPAHLFDPALSGLSSKEARGLLERCLTPNDSARLRWSETAFVFGRTGEAIRTSRLTGASAELRCGDGPGAGLAQAAARTLARLALPALAARARSRAVAAETLADLPALPTRLLLAPHAVAALVAELAGLLASDAYERGWPLGPEQLGNALLPESLTLLDDATSPTGLPCPFDGGGRPAAPVEHIARGVFRTPAVGSRLAASQGLVQTPQLVSEAEARPQHPTLGPGAAGPEALLAAVEDGAWIGSFSSLKTLAPGSSRIAARTANARRIAGARPGGTLPPLTIEGDLLEILRGAVAVGQEQRTFALDHDLLAGATVPALVLATGLTTRLRPS